MREIRDNNSMYTLNQDDIQMYLKDLRQIDVMTPEREKELPMRMLRASLKCPCRAKCSALAAFLYWL